MRVIGVALRESIADLPARLEFLSVEAEDCADFMRDLDGFSYLTNDTFFEAFGRMLLEAMASRLPVVAHRLGGGQIL